MSETAGTGDLPSHSSTEAAAPKEASFSEEKKEVPVDERRARNKKDSDTPNMGDKVDEEKSLPGDLIVGREIAKFRSKVDRGETLAEKEEWLFSSLRVAREAGKGDYGPYFREIAFRKMQESGDLGLDESLAGIKEDAAVAKQDLAESLIEKGLSNEEAEAFFKNADVSFVDVIKNGNVSDIEGLTEEIFGRELTDEELIKLLNPKEKANRAGILWLLLGTLSMEFVKQVSPIPVTQ